MANEDKKEVKFASTQVIKTTDVARWKHVLDDRSLFIWEGDKCIKIEGRERLTQLIESLGCRVVAL